MNNYMKFSSRSLYLFSSDLSKITRLQMTQAFKIICYNFQRSTIEPYEYKTTHFATIVTQCIMCINFQKRHHTIDIKIEKFYSHVNFLTWARSIFMTIVTMCNAAYRYIVA